MNTVPNAPKAENYEIRLIESGDNPAVCQLIMDILATFGCIGEGYASGDSETQRMYDAYQKPDSRYWVIADKQNGRILGAGGFSRLKGSTEEESICEMQKLYFYEELRGLGFGRKLIEMIIAEAARVGFKNMYLETIPTMEAAQALYRKYGFEYIDTHRGNTGHHVRCKVYMLRQLGAPVTTA